MTLHHPEEQLDVLCSSLHFFPFKIRSLAFFFRSCSSITLCFLLHWYGTQTGVWSTESNHVTFIQDSLERSVQTLHHKLFVWVLYCVD